MALATVLSKSMPVSRHIAAAERGFFQYMGQFAFPAGSTVTTCTIVLDQAPRTVLSKQATYGAAVVASDGPLYTTLSGSTLTVGRAAATTDAAAFDVLVGFE